MTDGGGCKVSATDDVDVVVPAAAVVPEVGDIAVKTGVVTTPVVVVVVEAVPPKPEEGWPVTVFDDGKPLADEESSEGTEESIGARMSGMVTVVPFAVLEVGD